MNAVKNSERMSCMRPVNPASATDPRRCRAGACASRSRARRLLRGRFLVHDHDAIEEIVHRCPQSDQALQAVRIAALLASRRARDRCNSDQRSVQSPLGLLAQTEGDLDRCLTCVFLQEYCAMRLLMRRQHDRIRQAQELLQRRSRVTASSGERGRLASTASSISSGRAVRPLEQQAAQALGDEVVHLIRHAGSLHRLRRGRCVEHLGEIQIQAALDQDAQHAERGAAQAERILGARRPLLDGKNADQRVDLVGERERLAHLRRRQRIAREARTIMLLDGARHFVRVALALRRSSVPWCLASSGNSPTMAVIRSALASSAAVPTSGPAAMRSPISARGI